jgi:hypothetical protein
MLLGKTRATLPNAVTLTKVRAQLAETAVSHLATIAPRAMDPDFRQDDG